MSIGAKVGTGNTAEIYVWQDGQDGNRVVKLFNTGYPLLPVQREADTARAAHEAGVNTPGVYDLVEVDGRHGLIYDRVDGVPLMNQLMAEPEVVQSVAQRMAELHASLHRVIVTTIRTMRERTQRELEQHFSESETAHFMSFMDTLPSANALCHNDFHPENILMAGSDLVIIDWMNGTSGHPHADVARTSLMLSIDVPPNSDEQTRRMIEALRDPLHDTYLTHYCDLTGTQQTEIDRWMPIVAAVRLTENVHSDKCRLYALINSIFDTPIR